MSFTLSEIINDIIKREGSATNDPTDKGGRTQFGIAEKSNPAAWKDGKVTLDEARAIYLRKYVVAPGFDKIHSVPLQQQLVDFGVVSGPAVAIQKLQHVLGVAEDGVLGPHTLAALAAGDVLVINNLLLAERIKLIGRIVHTTPSQVKFLNGWLNRALEFLV